MGLDFYSTPNAKTSPEGRLQTLFRKQKYIGGIELGNKYTD
jgi:hypothetical protein